MALKIVNDKVYTLKVEYLFDGTINFTAAGITRHRFESLSFREKIKIINKYAKFDDEDLKQCTDIEVHARIDR